MGPGDIIRWAGFRWVASRGDLGANAFSELDKYNLGWVAVKGYGCHCGCRCGCGLAKVPGQAIIISENS